MRSFNWILLGLVSCMISTGCALTHEAQPHRLWRFNRGPGPSSNPYFSVNDPIASPQQRATGWAPHKPNTGDTRASLDTAHESPVADRD